MELDQSKRFQDKVRKVIIRYLDVGDVNMETVSKELHLSSRTVYRKLREENVSYKTLLNETRKQLAQAYLGETEFSINEISYLLGFSETSAFHRAFKRWFGGQSRSIPTKHRGIGVILNDCGTMNRPDVRAALEAERIALPGASVIMKTGTI